MATPFRQVIRPGDVGRDVWAVKRALIKMGIRGSGAMARTHRAGPAFVTVLHRAQRQDNEVSDGIYGKKTHAFISPHFDAYGKLLYRTAKIRKLPIPPIPVGDAQVNAKKLLQLRAEGKYRADNGGDLIDLSNTANGKAVWSRGGYYVHIDARVMRVLVWLIEDKGFKIGTFAFCSDHNYDGPHGHAGGFAVDISSINGVSVASPEARQLTLDVAEALRNAPGDLRPRQLICGGYGYRRDMTISACSIPGPDWYYGSTTMSEHCNHIHNGY